jgi:hypothetical protein
MRSSTHPMHTRLDSLAAAAAAAPAAPPPPPMPALFTIAELEACQSTADTVQLFIDRGMLLPLDRPCAHCARPLRASLCDSKLDGYRLRCPHCKGDHGVRAGSPLAHYRISLRELGRLLCYFNAHLTVTQAHCLSAVSEDTVTRLWKQLRESARDFLTAHPILFSGDEIVEIDELYLKPLRPGLDEFEERGKWAPVIGLISRQTGAVALEIAPSHSTRDIAPLIRRHLPSLNTSVITDEHKSFQFLDDESLHEWCEKERRGPACWPRPKSSLTQRGEPFSVHTNTIEGYWSQLRTWLHASHGWTADYLPLFLYECMFRSTHRPLTTLLRAAPPPPVVP